jgi:hypothetical protein
MSTSVTVHGTTFQVPDKQATDVGYLLHDFFHTLSHDDKVTPLTSSTYSCTGVGTAQIISDSGNLFVNTTSTAAVVHGPTVSTTSAGVAYGIASVSSGTTTFSTASGAAIVDPAGATVSFASVSTGTVAKVVAVTPSTWVVLSTNGGTVTY